jgi:hypothetical protein
MNFVLLAIVFALTACSTQKKRVEVGAFDADGLCPSFQAQYPKCDIKYGTKGLSFVSALYKVFTGEGFFEIKEFRVRKLGDKEFEIAADSNRGLLRSRINADGLVRIGQDQEDNRLRNANVSSYCHAGRIFENQTVQVGDDLEIQDLEFWTEGEVFHFQL